MIFFVRCVCGGTVHAVSVDQTEYPCPLCGLVLSRKDLTYRPRTPSATTGHAD